MRYAIRRRTLLAALAASPLFTATAARAQEESVIALDLSRGQPRVRLSIGGVDRGEAIFDTGASGSALDSALAETLGLPNQGAAGVRSGAGGDVIEAYRTTVSGALIGAAPAPDFTAVVMPMLRPDTVAVLSPNIFAGALVELDFGAAHMRIRTKSAANIPASTPIPYDDGPRPLPSIPLSLPGDVAMLAHLDTGAPRGIVLPREMADTLPLSTPLTEAGRARLINGERIIYAATLAGTAQVGPLRLHNPQIEFMEGIPHGNIGMALLRQLAITLDPAERRLWVATA